MVNLFEGFKLFTSYIETEFVEDRLFGYNYLLLEEDFNNLFGTLAVKLDYADFPKNLIACLSDEARYDEDKSYFLVKYGFDKFIFSRGLNTTLLSLEYSYTDGLEYVLCRSFFENIKLITA